MRRNLIVGLDTGITAAVALLDLEGKLITLKSSKDFSKSTLSRYISNFGNPVLIASDRKFPPKLLEKIAAVFSARVVSPTHNLSKRGKTNMLQSFELVPKTKHERDALAAALYVWERVKPLVEKIDRKLANSKFSKSQNVKEKIKRSILCGEERNIEAAITSVEKVKELKAEQEIPPIKIETEVIRNLKSKLAIKTREVEILKHSADILKNRIKVLEYTIAKLRKEIDEKQAEMKKELLGNQAKLITDLKTRLKNSELSVKELENDIERLEALTMLEIENWMPVLVTKYCDKPSMRKLDNRYGLTDKWICILSDKKVSGISQLNKVKGIVCKGKLVELIRSKGISAINLEETELKYYKNFGVMKVDLDLIRKEKEQSFSSWLEEYKKRVR